MSKSRRVRRKRARELANKIPKITDRDKYKAVIVWFLSFLLPIFWSEFASGKQPRYVIVECLLWLIPVCLSIRVLFEWSKETGKLKGLKYVLSAGLLLLYTAVAGYSIKDALKPQFIIIWPGLALIDNQSRIYYLAARKRPITNASIIVLDDGEAGNQLSFKVPELDPRKGGIADSFSFKPTSLGHEKMTIIVQSADVDTNQKLEVRTRGYALFPSYKSVIRDGSDGKVIFQCESEDFPDKGGLPDCGTNPFVRP